MKKKIRKFPKMKTKKHEMLENRKGNMKMEERKEEKPDSKIKGNSKESNANN